jgi:hypothetical protein
MPGGGVRIAEKCYPRSVVAPGFIAIGSGPAGLSAAETFRSKHPHIPVRILTTDQVVGVLSLNADDDYRLADPRCSGRTPR